MKNVLVWVTTTKDGGAAGGDFSGLALGTTGTLLPAGTGLVAFRSRFIKHLPASLPLKN